jgi:small subunit ribosomal protein S2
MVDLKRLIKSGVQFGHQTWRWCPKMKPYIWGEKNGVHLIDVSKTAIQIEKAAKFLESLAASGKPILWVGTKKAAQAPVLAAAKESQSPHVIHRWIGGTITNNSQVRKSITKLLHFEDIVKKSSSDQFNYTKKEYGKFQKIVDRLTNNVGGIRKLGWPIGALVIVDVKKEHVALKEAQAAGIPVVALVDTNGDPSMIDYVIPGNDDVTRAISAVLESLAEAVKRGKAVATTQATQEATAEQMIEQLVEQALAGEEEEDKPKRGRRPSGDGSRRPQQRRPAAGPQKPSPQE